MMIERDADIGRITRPYNMTDARVGTFSFDVAAVARLAVESRNREDVLRSGAGLLADAIADYLESGTPTAREHLESLMKQSHPPVNSQEGEVRPANTEISPAAPEFVADPRVLPAIPRKQAASAEGDKYQAETAIVPDHEVISTEKSLLLKS